MTTPDECCPDGNCAGHQETQTPQGVGISRRSALTGGVAAAAALGATALAGGIAKAQGTPSPGSSPWDGRRFRGLISGGGKIEVAELELIWPIDPKAVIIATEAVQTSYTNTDALNGKGGGGGPPSPGVDYNVVGYSGVGRVVYVGDQVRRVVVGDRVVVGVTPQCGVCYNCLHGRGDMCQFLESSGVNGAFNPPFARIVGDGAQVAFGRGGFAELMMTTDDWVVPVYTDLPGSALSLLGSVGMTGIAGPTSFVPVEPGSDVVVFGCGPIGLSAVNGAAIMGANRIIAVEPIAYRREAALAVGATDVVNPTGKDDTLVKELQDMLQPQTGRYYSGGRGSAPFGFLGFGPDYIFEATGAQRWDPSERGIEPQPDPTGIRELLQIYQLCPGYGSIVTTGLRMGDITMPAGNLTISGKRHFQAQYGGGQLMRDSPRIVHMMERGQYKWDKIVSVEYPLEQAIQALEETAYRQKVSTHVVFDPKQFME